MWLTFRNSGSLTRPAFSSVDKAFSCWRGCRQQLWRRTVEYHSGGRANSKGHAHRVAILIGVERLVEGRGDNEVSSSLTQFFRWVPLSLSSSLHGWPGVSSARGAPSLQLLCAARDCRTRRWYNQRHSTHVAVALACLAKYISLAIARTTKGLRNPMIAGKRQTIETTSSSAEQRGAAKYF